MAAVEEGDNCFHDVPDADAVEGVAVVEEGTDPDN